MLEWDLNWIPAAGSTADEEGNRQHFDYMLQDLYTIISPPHVIYMHSNALICAETHRAVRLLALIGPRVCIEMRGLMLCNYSRVYEMTLYLDI